MNRRTQLFGPIHGGSRFGCRDRCFRCATSCAHPLCNPFYVCSNSPLTIRPDTKEVELAIAIALKTAPTYALRNAFTPAGKLNRQVAIETLTARVFAALRPYELSREPNSHGHGSGTLPLFPDDRVQNEAALGPNGKPEGWRMVKFQND